ncbi:cytochrome P450 76A2-like [Hibiscus syriacus]|uniref:Cytochrome P450 76A2-like n=1 Tax=Hibiscus syriacus TaxID=106335 RepID=A0A6A2ZEF0_HIBSY|nr:cytochrome P450 76A2-like [Hibiscus syriacus]
MESWFGGSWLNPRKSSSESNGKVLGILAFEVASLMSKAVSLWHFLDDGEILKLRKQITNSVGIRRLVSDNQNYLMDLALNEIIENFGTLATSVARLGKKCTDPVYHCFEHFVIDPISNNLDWLGWDYRLKKMERKVKKMERRMRRNAKCDQDKLLECRKKVMLQRREVKKLRETSPWARTYDFVVRILLRTLLTILERIKYVFRTNQMVSLDGKNSPCLLPSDSFSALIPCSSRSYSKTKRSNHVRVGPFRRCVSAGSNSLIFDSCETIGSGSFRFIGAYTTKMESLFGNDKIYSKLCVFNTKHLLDAPTSTLGDVALCLRYAHIIIMIEKLASAPHMIGLDSREKLYNMLPWSMRNAVRAKLKSDAKTLASFVISSSFAAEWRLVIVRILGWLAPLAHNMIRWQLERSFEEQHMVSRSNVLLVQTLHFANRAKTEAAIIDILVGLNYVCRIEGAHNSITF